MLALQCRYLHSTSVQSKRSLLQHFGVFCVRHQVDGAKDPCHRAHCVEPPLGSAVRAACLTCAASLASRLPPHSGERAHSHRVCSASLLHIPRICLWFTEQVSPPSCLDSCFGIEQPTPSSPSPPPPITSTGGVKTTRAPLPVRFSSAGGTRR